MFSSPNFIERAPVHRHKDSSLSTEFYNIYKAMNKLFDLVNKLDARDAASIEAIKKEVEAATAVIESRLAALEATATDHEARLVAGGL